MKIGIDGGGTKTELILVDDAGEIVARHVAAGCNPNVVGPDQARAILDEAIDALLAQADGPGADQPVQHTLLCMAGAPAFWREVATGLDGLGRVETCDDSRPVLELATEGGPGLVLHGGTGSFVAARGRDGEVHYGGGLGWRLGDAGSGYDLGRRMLSRALLELQGWMVPTRLSQCVRDFTHLMEEPAIKRYFYQHAEPNRQIATLAPVLLRLATEGDDTARWLVTESCGELLTLAVTVADRVFPGEERGVLVCGVSGPVLTHPVAMEALRVQSPFTLRAVAGPPIEGVRLLLGRLGAGGR
ncbi:putative N-acetylglucosamine kinase [Opitutaceae bacterium TAV1]|nr:putative N-acetylglucosamine kinase [Opitutaceae bacterium TAV1]